MYLKDEKINNRGFTLVELLAIIVIIRILSLIVIPLVIGIIDNAKKNAFKESVNGLIRAVRNDSDMKNYEESTYVVDKGILYNSDNVKIQTSGGEDEQGSLYIKENGEIAASVNNGRWCAIKKFSDNSVNITDYVDGECKILYEGDLPTYIVNPKGDVWAKSKTVTIIYPELGKNFDCEYSKNGTDNWKKVTGKLTEDVIFTADGNITARISDGINYYTASTLSVTKIDSIPPVDVSVNKTESTSQSITVKASGVDNESGIKEYQFSKDDGETWINNGSSNTYTFINLKTSSYKVRVKVIDKVGNETISEPVTMSTNSITLPTYSVNPAGDVWAKSKTVTITYPERQENYIYQYSVDNGVTWLTVTNGTTATYTFNENGNIIARIYDGINYYTASTLAVTKVDSIAPSFESVTNSSNGNWTNQNVTINAMASDNYSGIDKIDYSYDNSSWFTDWDSNDTNSVMSVWSEEKNTPLYIRATDNAGNFSIYTTSLKIDKTGPTFSNLSNSSNGNWTNQNVIIQSNLIDNLSGIDETQTKYSYDGVNWYNDWTSSTQSSFKGVWSAQRNNTTYIKVTDNVGNSTTYTTYIKIDKTPPIVSYSNFAGAYKESITYISSLGIKYEFYYNDELSGVSSWYAWVIAGSCNSGWKAAGTSLCPSGSARAPYWRAYKIRDNAGNYSNIICSYTTTSAVSKGGPSASCTIYGKTFS